MPLPQNCIWYRPQFHFNQVPPFSKCSRECDDIYWVAGGYIQSQDQQVRLSVRIRQRGYWHLSRTDSAPWLVLWGGSNGQAIYRKHVRARDVQELHLISEGQEGLLFIQWSSNIYRQWRRKLRKQYGRQKKTNENKIVYPVD